jgi:hypothetical protein
MGEGGVRRPDSKCAHVMRVHSSRRGLCPSGRGRSLVVSGGFDKGELDSFLVDACCVNGLSFLKLEILVSIKEGERIFGKTHGAYGHT